MMKKPHFPFHNKISRFKNFGGRALISNKNIKIGRRQFLQGGVSAGLVMAATMHFIRKGHAANYYNMPTKTLLLGIGDCGTNFANRFFQQHTGFTVAIANKHSITFEDSPLVNKIQLSDLAYEKRGPGFLLALREKAAQDNRKNIENFISTFGHIILIAGLGGRTGSGATPAIAKFCNDMKITVSAIVTLPFNFEGERRNDKALKSLKILRNSVHSIAAIKNENLIQNGKIDKKTTFAEGFALIDLEMKRALNKIMLQMS